jgi:FkbM family methyltransferase
VITYAQNFEDVILDRLFAGQADGFYVDVGASHPVDLSVTKHFYDRGWSGVNIEPIRRNHELFLKERPRDTNVDVALGARDEERTFFEVEQYDALSTFDAEQAKRIEAMGYKVQAYPVRTVTADTLLEQLGLHERTIDFLKIDVEGFEAEVISGLDLARFRPRVLLVESITPGYQFPGWDSFDPVLTHERWEPRVLAAGYKFIYFDGISRYYLAPGEEALAQRLRVPPGIFDSIVFAREEAQRESLEEARAGLAREAEAHAAKERALALAQDRIAGLEEELEHERAQRAREHEELTQALASLDAQRRAEAELAFERAKGVRARLRDLRGAARERAKYYFLAALLRLASGKPSPPLPSMSLVVPAFNAEATIADTLESILAQDYPALEVIVVDGASTDGTLGIVREYEARTDLRQRIARVVSEPDRGMYDAIGKGFDVATGEVLCYLNADDLLEAGGLMKAGRYFADHPAADVIYHEDTVLVDGWKYANARQPEGVDTIDLLNGHILFQDGVFFRRRAYEACGGVRRDLRLAGDYDLWLRMSAAARFVRRPGHASCFRIRPGQLSTDMARYHGELEQARGEFLAARPALVRAAWLARARLRRATRLVRARLQRERLFYPIDFAHLPPPAASVPATAVAANAPLSPVDGRPAERLLFSCMDTRFGERDMNYIYLDERHGVAITHPPIEPARLDALYRKHYSNPPTRMKLPEGTSPYRQIDRVPLWERLLLKLPVEYAAVALFRGAWADNTLAELRAVLRSAGIDVASPLRVLDTGCFEGHLLDQIRACTPWRGFGLEPNDTAVEVARGKGHTVWHAHAEAATEAIPEGEHFDVVFMGQSIEHVDDPVRVLRRLRMLLAPGGVIVASTPNLDSRQIDWFGPTWAHWHPPYHRFIFSRAGIRQVARQAGLVPSRLKTFSHPYWTSITLAQNWLGLGGSVSHAVAFDRSITRRAQRIDFWARLFWNRVGRGDYLFLLMTDGEHG